MLGIDIFVSVVTGVLVFILFVLLFRGRILPALLLAIIGGYLGWHFSALYVVPHYEAWQLEREVKKNPLIKMIAKTNPVDYANFMQQVRSVISYQQSPSQAVVYSFRLVHRVFPQYLSRAPNQAVMTYLEATIALYEQLLRESPQLVVQAEFPRNIDNVTVVPLLRTKNEHFVMRRQQAMVDIIKLASRQPQLQPNSAYAQTLLTQVIDQLSKKYGRNFVIMVITQPDNPTLPQETAAAIIIAFYKDIYNLGETNAGSLMRYIGAHQLRNKP